MKLKLSVKKMAKRVGKSREKEREGVGTDFQALSFSVIIVFDAPISRQIEECNKRRRFHPCQGKMGIPHSSLTFTRVTAYKCVDVFLKCPSLRKRKDLFLNTKSKCCVDEYKRVLSVFEFMYFQMFKFIHFQSITIMIFFQENT